jgi:hypothetical protein
MPIISPPQKSLSLNKSPIFELPTGLEQIQSRVQFSEMEQDYVTLPNTITNLRQTRKAKFAGSSLYEHDHEIYIKNTFLSDAFSVSPMNCIQAFKRMAKLLALNFDSDKLVRGESLYRMCERAR